MGEKPMKLSLPAACLRFQVRYKRDWKLWTLTNELSGPMCLAYGDAPHVFRMLRRYLKPLLPLLLCSFVMIGCAKVQAGGQGSQIIRLCSEVTSHSEPCLLNGPTAMPTEPRDVPPKEWDADEPTGTVHMIPCDPPISKEAELTGVVCMKDDTWKVHHTECADKTRFLLPDGNGNLHCLRLP